MSSVVELPSVDAWEYGCIDNLQHEIAVEAECLSPMAQYKMCVLVQESSSTEASSKGEFNQDSDALQPAVLPESNMDVPARSSSPALKHRLGSRCTGRITRQSQNIEPA